LAFHCDTVEDVEESVRRIIDRKEEATSRFLQKRMAPPSLNPQKSKKDHRNEKADQRI
jgi:hypothetical protein